MKVSLLINKTLNNIAWKSFQIGGENGVFKINSTSSGIDKNKLNRDKGDIPYITRTDLNNGISEFVGEHQDEKYSMNYGNVIVVGLDTQTIFYQKTKFYTGQNIQVLENDYLTSNIALFIIPLLKKQLSKFNWGGNGATLYRLNRSKVLLPVTPNGEIDWEYIEAYGSRLLKLKYNQLKVYLENKLVEIKKDNHDFSMEAVVSFRSFIIGDILEIYPGKRLTKEDMKMGMRPFVGSTEFNNGITAFVSNNNSSLDSNVLGVNYNGSVGNSFYHPYEALFSDDVKRLRFINPKARNKYNYLFLKTTIIKQKNKYQYGYKFNGSRMKKQKIMLPIDEQGLPNWDYMTWYMKNLEMKNIDKLIKYINKRLHEL